MYAIAASTAVQHRDEADWHAGLHRSFVAGNPSRQQLIATLGGQTTPVAVPRQRDGDTCPDRRPVPPQPGRSRCRAQSGASSRPARTISRVAGFPLEGYE
jgi:hypothetical protein